MEALTKRQLTESRKRHLLISDLLSEKANIKEVRTNYESGYMSFIDHVKNRELTLMTFYNYRELKRGQDYIIKLLKSIDHIIETEYTLFCARSNNY